MLPKRSKKEQGSGIDKKGPRESFTTKVNMVPVLRIKALVDIWSLCQTDETCTVVGNTEASHFDLERRVYLQEIQNMFAFEHHGQKGPPDSSEYRSRGFSLIFSSVHSFQHLRRAHLFIPHSVHMTLSACCRTLAH